MGKMELIIEKIENLLAIIAAIIAIFSLCLLWKSFQLRSYKNVDVSSNIYLNNKLDTEQDLNNLITDGYATLCQRITFSNNTLDPITLSDICLNYYRKNEEGEYDIIKYKLDYVTRNGEKIDKEKNSYLTLSPGEARDGILHFYSRSFTKDELMMLLATENNFEANKSIAYRIISDVLEDTYSDWENISKLSYKYYGRDAESSYAIKIKYNDSSSTSSMNRNTINERLSLEKVEFNYEDPITKALAFQIEETKVTAEIREKYKQEINIETDLNKAAFIYAYSDGFLHELYQNENKASPTQLESINEYTGLEINNVLLIKGNTLEEIVSNPDLNDAIASNKSGSMGWYAWEGSKTEEIYVLVFFS